MAKNEYMRIFNHSIPSAFIVKQNQLIAPPGVNIQRLAEIVANQIASTIIHEAAHGARWAREYLSGNMQLEHASRSTEEYYAEQAEQRAGLQTELTSNIYDTSESEDTMNEEELLSRAIQISNSKNDFYIPRNSVKNVKLSSEHWGEFEMIQGGDLKHSSNISVAWDDNDRKLMVDVAAIIDTYNRAVAGGQQLKNERNMTNQTDGVEPDISGISKDNPLSPFTDAVPGRQSIPGRASVPSV